jgi:predicted membrane protein
MEMYLTPHRSSAMAMFGFVYLWYLMVVLVLEIWLEFRADIVRALANHHRPDEGGLSRASRWAPQNISPAARIIDDKVGYAVTVIGIPSAFLLHGYVGFIFGSVKANPVVVLAAHAGGLPLLGHGLRDRRGHAALHGDHEGEASGSSTCAAWILSRCICSISFVIDFSLEMLDLIHRTYEADESFRSLDFMVHTRLMVSQIILQICLGTLVPLALLAANQLWRFREAARRAMYTVACSLTLMGIFAMRWNVVIGGQLFSKSFLGYTSYKMSLVTKEGLLMAILLTILPLVILWGLVKLLPPWQEQSADSLEPAA